MIYKVWYNNIKELIVDYKFIIDIKINTKITDFMIVNIDLITYY